MASKKISDLPAVGTSLTTAAMVEISMGGASSSATIANITTLQQGTALPIAAGGTGATAATTAATALNVLPLTGGSLTGTMGTTGNLNAQTGTAIPVGGTQGIGHLFSSTANFGIIFGSGVGAASMARGSVMLRSDGPPSVNMEGTTSWAPIGAVLTPAVTTTGSYSMLANDTAIIFNGAATCTLTLLGAATNSGRTLMVKTLAAQSLNASAAIILPQTSATATTLILGATSGKWALLQAVGTTWTMLMSN